MFQNTIMHHQQEFLHKKPEVVVDKSAVGTK
jgi:hypothetical protein